MMVMINLILFNFKLFLSGLSGLLRYYQYRGQSAFYFQTISVITSFYALSLGNWYYNTPKLLPRYLLGPYFELDVHLVTI